MHKSVVKVCPNPITLFVSTIKLSENLRRLMGIRGLNQVELAKKSGVGQDQISRYLRIDRKGKYPGLHNLVALSQALDCTLEELTGMEALHGIEEKVAEHQPTPKALAFAEALEKLSESDPRRKAIEMLLTDELSNSKEEKIPGSDTDVKPDK